MIQERISLKNSLCEENSSGIIAEFKRKSPSKGVINDEADLFEVVMGYDEFAAGISVLTDEKYFGGNNDDLLEARNITSVPLLRKDFIIDEFQLYEAKGIWRRCNFINCCKSYKAASKTSCKICKEL